MKCPNLFIVGAPKCGTTAMASYLSEHPDVYVSDPKEPNYFLHPKSSHRKFKSYTHYLSLFRGAGEEKYLCDASIWYLYSKYAAEGILNKCPDAKIIVMRRDPVGFIRSLHSQLVFGRYESLDLEASWRKNCHRLHDGDSSIETQCDWELMYSELVKFDKYIAVWTNLFGEKNLLVVDQNDLAGDPLSTYKSVLEFLGVRYDNRVDFTRVNTNKIVKYHLLQDYLIYVSRIKWLRAMSILTKRALGVSSLGIYKFFRNLNHYEGERAVVDDVLIEKMRDFYNDK